MTEKQIRSEKKKLQARIDSLEQRIKQMPEGWLTIARNGKNLRFYHSFPGGRKYIPKEKRALAGQMAQKRYLTAQREDAKQELGAMNAALEYLARFPENAEKLLDEPGMQHLLGVSSASASEKAWAQAEYPRNPFHPEALIYRSSSGNVLRSKSECMIDMALHLRGIAFRYECAFPIGGADYYPDFTILHPVSGEMVLWEHFGMMDDMAYAAGAYRKLQAYSAAGFVPGVNLIASFETQQRPLSSSQIDLLIATYLE